MGLLFLLNEVLQLHKIKFNCLLQEQGLNVLTSRPFIKRGDQKPKTQYIFFPSVPSRISLVQLFCFFPRYFERTSFRCLTSSSVCQTLKNTLPNFGQSVNFLEKLPIILAQDIYCLFISDRVHYKWWFFIEDNYRKQCLP